MSHGIDVETEQVRCNRNNREFYLPALKLNLEIKGDN